MLYVFGANSILGEAIAMIDREDRNHVNVFQAESGKVHLELLKLLGLS